jgi:hypothetical protein
MCPDGNAFQREVENNGHFSKGSVNYFDGTCIDLSHFLALELYVSAASVLCLGTRCIILLLLAWH